MVMHHRYVFAQTAGGNVEGIFSTLLGVYPGSHRTPTPAPLWGSFPNPGFGWQAQQVGWEQPESQS